MRHINLFSILISITSKSESLAIITQWVMERKKEKGKRKKVDESLPSSFFLHPSSLRRPKVVVTPNPEMVVAAQHDREFLQALQGADLAIPDGWGIVAAMRVLQGKRKKEKGKRKDWSFPSAFFLHPSSLERISGLSLMENLIALAARRGWRVMLVGGEPGVAERAAELLRRKKEKGKRKKVDESLPSSFFLHPSSLTIHALSGPPDISHASPHDLDHLITSINKIKPDLLFVAFGHGKQEKWMAQHRDRLDVGVMMGVGGALDQIVDTTLRPPAIIDSIGLGWLYRLLREPWRWRRQLSLLTFAWMVFYRRVWFKEE